MLIYHLIEDKWISCIGVQCVLWCAFSWYRWRKYGLTQRCSYSIFKELWMFFDSIPNLNKWQFLKAWLEYGTPSLIRDFPIEIHCIFVLWINLLSLPVFVWSCFGHLETTGLPSFVALLDCLHISVSEVIVSMCTLTNITTHIIGKVCNDWETVKFMGLRIKFPQIQIFASKTEFISNQNSKLLFLKWQFHWVHFWEDV